MRFPENTQQEIEVEGESGGFDTRAKPGKKFRT
jgi:hypothetical protein